MTLLAWYRSCFGCLSTQRMPVLAILGALKIRVLTTSFSKVSRPSKACVCLRPWYDERTKGTDRGVLCAACDEFAASIHSRLPLVETLGFWRSMLGTAPTTRTLGSNFWTMSGGASWPRS